jgi:hypothetical protein
LEVAGADVRVILRDRDDQRGDVLGDLVVELRRVGMQDLGTPAICAALGRLAAVVAGDSTWMSPPIFCAAVTALSVDLRTDLLSCSANTRMVMGGAPQMTLASLRSFSTSVFASGTLLPALRFRRLDHLQRLQARRDVDAERIGFSVSSVFFFAFMMFGSVT